MRILIYSNLYRPELSGVAIYSGGMAESLVNMGHDVHVIAANPSYPYWKLFEGFPRFGWTRTREQGITVHRCPVFVPSKVTGLTRILHYLTFAANAAWPAARLAMMFRPDVVIHVAPTMVASPMVLFFAWLVRSKTWLHVQDFEVEAGIAMGQMQSSGRAARLALAFERTCIRAYHQTSSISFEMCRKLIDKGREPASVYELRNWAELAEVRPQATSAFRDRWSIAAPQVALYSGSIARKQGIEIILEVARLLVDRRDLVFIICGDGPDRGELERQASTLPNVMIKGLQPMAELGELLSLATIHLLPQKAEAADLVLPSKLTNMLASGRPVIATAAAGTGLAREVEGVGIVTAPGDAAALGEAIVRLIDNDNERAKLGAAARARAEQVWDRDTILRNFEERLSALGSS